MPFCALFGFAFVDPSSKIQGLSFRIQLGNLRAMHSWLFFFLPIAVFKLVKPLNWPGIELKTQTWIPKNAELLIEKQG
jgi:hypothetical protein